MSLRWISTWLQGHVLCIFAASLADVNATNGPVACHHICVTYAAGSANICIVHAGMRARTHETQLRGNSVKMPFECIKTLH